MSAFTDKHRNDLFTLLDAPVKAVKASCPVWRSLGQRIATDLQSPFATFLDKLDAIRSSGRYSPDGERAERRAAARTSRTTGQAARGNRGESRRAAGAQGVSPALKTDHRSIGCHPPRDASTRNAGRVAGASEGFPHNPDAPSADGRSRPARRAGRRPAGFPIAPPELIEAARIRIAEQNDPASGELAQLKAAYEYAIGAAEQVLSVRLVCRSWKPPPNLPPQSTQAGAREWARRCSRDQ